MKISRLIRIVLASIILMVSLGLAGMPEWKATVPVNESMPIRITQPDNITLSDIMATSDNMTLEEIEAIVDIMVMSNNTTIPDNVTLLINTTIPTRIILPLSRITTELEKLRENKRARECLDLCTMGGKEARVCYDSCFGPVTVGSGEGPSGPRCSPSWGACLPDPDSSTGYSKLFQKRNCDNVIINCRPNYSL
jgi:hypothetical protein